MSDRYTACLGSYLLDCEQIEDSFDKAIAVHEVPYRNGAILDDLGQKARRVRIRCYFYEDRYDEHYDFLEDLKALGTTEFTHPRYGLMQGMIESVSVRHDDRARMAEIDIGFVENMRGSIETDHRPDVKGAAESIYADGIEEQKQAVAEMAGLYTATAAYIKAAEGFIGRMESTLTAISNPANTLIAAIEFGTDLPGRVIGALTGVAERYSLLYDSLKTMPEKFTANFKDAMTELAGQVDEFGPLVDAAGALRLALDLGGIFSEDEDARDIVRSLERTAAFDSLGRYVKAQTTPELLDIGQIEGSLAIANAYIQTAISQDRTQTSLKSVARILTTHALQVKIESEKLVTIWVDHATPLHLICLRRGLPYNYAERLWRVNRLTNPNEVQGEMQVYVG